MLHTWGSNENISFAWTPNSAKDVMASMIYGQCLQNRNQVVRYMRQKKLINSLILPQKYLMIIN